MRDNNTRAVVPTAAELAETLTQHKATVQDLQCQERNGQGADIAAVIVRRGLARDCARFSGGRYLAAETQAAAAGATIRTNYPLPGYCKPR